ncbi:hypothetical protein [Azospirillum largimobile]
MPAPYLQTHIFYPSHNDTIWLKKNSRHHHRSYKSFNVMLTITYAILPMAP